MGWCRLQWSRSLLAGGGETRPKEGDTFELVGQVSLRPAPKEAGYKMVEQARTPYIKPRSNEHLRRSYKFEMPLVVCYVKSAIAQRFHCHSTCRGLAKRTHSLNEGPVNEALSAGYDSCHVCFPASWHEKGFFVYVDSLEQAFHVNSECSHTVTPIICVEIYNAIKRVGFRPCVECCLDEIF